MKGLSVVSFFNDISSEMIYPLLPAFVSRFLGAGAITLGAIDGAAQLASACLNWVSGRLSDRPGLRKPLILVGYGTAILVRPLISTAITAWQVVGLRVLDRVGKGLRSAPRDALIAESTPAELHGRAFGMNRAADHAGAVLGALIGGWALVAAIDVRTIIGLSAVPGVVALVVLSIVLKGQGEVAGEAGKRDERTHTDGLARPAAVRGDAVGPASLRSLFSHPSPGTISLLALLVLVRLPELLLIYRLQQLGVAIVAIPFAWAGLHLIRSLASYPAGRLQDRIGPDLLIGLGAAVAALCLCLLGKALPPLAALGVFLLFGLVAAFTEPAERALVARLSPKGLGKGFGLYYALTGLAALPAALAYGWIWERSGSNDALWLSGALVGVVGLVWMARRRTPSAGAAAAMVAFLLLTGCGTSGHDRAEDARIVTEDVARFAAALEPALAADSAGAARVLDSAYHHPGSAGLQDWWRSRVGDPGRLAAAVRLGPERYRRVSSAVLAPGVPDSLHAAVLRIYRELERRVPGATFPDVYLLLGRGNSGGTTSGAGLLIGLEVALRDSAKGPDALVPMIAHELIHFQQPWQFGRSTLLDGSYREGSADFVAELVAGRTINTRQREYGLAHEGELWREFQGVMEGKDHRGWLYGGAPDGRPQDLGYFFGYRIAQAYYEQAVDKDLALREILTARHARPLLEASGYSPR